MFNEESVRYNRYVIILVVLIHVFSNTSAQTNIKISVGYTHNYPNKELESGLFEDLQAEGGAHLSVLLDHSMAKKLKVRSGIALIQKNYSLQRIPPYQSIYKRYDNLYLQVPLVTGLDVIHTNKFCFTLYPGVYGGYWVSSKTEGTIPNTFNSTYDVTESGEVLQNFEVTEYQQNNNLDEVQFNRFEFGWMFGGEFVYSVHNEWSLAAEVAYQYALNKQYKSVDGIQNQLNNRTWLTTLGILFSLK